MWMSAFRHLSLVTSSVRIQREPTSVPALVDTSYRKMERAAEVSHTHTDTSTAKQNLLNITSYWVTHIKYSIECTAVWVRGKETDFPLGTLKFKLKVLLDLVSRLQGRVDQALCQCSAHCPKMHHLDWLFPHARACSETFTLWHSASGSAFVYQSCLWVQTSVQFFRTSFIFIYHSLSPSLVFPPSG